MDTKMDTIADLRIWPPDVPAWVPIWCPLFIRTNSRTLYHSSIKPRRRARRSGCWSRLFKTRQSGKQAPPRRAVWKKPFGQARTRPASRRTAGLCLRFGSSKTRIVTFHDLEDPDGPLACVVDENDIETLDVTSLTRAEDLRNLVLSLLNMALSRHIGRSGLVIDEEKTTSLFFPSKDGAASAQHSSRERRGSRSRNAHWGCTTVGALSMPDADCLRAARPRLQLDAVFRPSLAGVNAGEIVGAFCRSRFCAVLCLAASSAGGQVRAKTEDDDSAASW